MVSKNHIVQVVVKVLDQATDPLKRISDRTKNMSSDFSKIGSSIGAFSNKMDSLAKGLDKVANSMYKFNMYTSSIQRNIKNLALIGLGGATALGINATNDAIDFEYKTTKMQTKMGASRAVRDDISDYILNDLNYRVAFTPSEIADLGIILGQGGIDSKEDMKSLLNDVAFFSEAVDAVPAVAGEMLIAALKGFDKPFSEAGEVSDKLAVALNQSLLTVEELPHALGQLAGRAKMYGQSLDSSLVALMVARDQGMGSAQASQNLLFGLRQLTQVGNEEFAQPRRMEYFRKGGIDTSFFDIEKRQLKEFPEIIAALENSLFNLGWMPNKNHFYEVVNKNDGRIPDGLIDKMSAMPMIQRVFGAAGQTPLIMGLQARYEEVDKQTGEKTGLVLYGSDALKRMRQDMQEAQGLVEKLHAEIEQTTRFQLERLTGAWQASKIKLTSDFLPVIRVAADELTNYFSGNKMSGGLDRLNAALKESINNLREASPAAADFVENLSKAAISAGQVISTTPETFKQIGESFQKNIMDKEWGNSLWTMPYYAVKNGFGFIGDVMAGNDAADRAISQLPPELQDSAQLTRKLIQGGVVIVAAGAIIKIVELAFRSAAAMAKGVDLGKKLWDIIFGTSGKKNPLGDAMRNMNISANIVNVYGGAINDGGKGNPVPGGGRSGKPGGGGSLPPRSQTHGKRFRLPNLGKWAKWGGVASLGLGFTEAINWTTNRFQEMKPEDPYKQLPGNYNISQNAGFNKSIADMGKLLTKPSAEQIIKVVDESSLKSITDSQVNEIRTFMQFIDSNNNKNTSLLMQGYEKVNGALKNLRVENKINLNISGNIQEKIPDFRASLSEDVNRALDIQESVFYNQARRFPKN